MNKSEIAERAAREMMNLYRPNEKAFTKIVERAIAESQDSQDCEKVAERVTPAGKQIPPEMTELGDGEPSPPPAKCKSCRTILYRTLGEKGDYCDQCGAAQEVSPVGSVYEIRPRPDDPSCHVCGAQMAVKEWKCLSCATTTGCSDGEVSPPSPEPYSFDIASDEEIARRAVQVGPCATGANPSAYGSELGDTRELKAALKRAYELAHIFQKKVSWFKLSNESHEEYTAAWKELKEAERQLLDR